MDPPTITTMYSTLTTFFIGIHVSLHGNIFLNVNVGCPGRCDDSKIYENYLKITSG